jgi:hypothetical protein
MSVKSRTSKNEAEKEEKQNHFLVSGNQVLELPRLSMGQLDLAMSDDAERFVRHTIHNEKMMGWPDTSDFKSEGFVIQPTSTNRARVILLIDHPSALTLLAMYVKTYEHIGYELVIDKDTYFRSGFILGEKDSNKKEEISKASDEAVQTLDSYGMEVA